MDISTMNDEEREQFKFQWDLGKMTTFFMKKEWSPRYAALLCMKYIESLADIEADLEKQKAQGIENDKEENIS